MARKILLADDSVTAQNMGRKILADAGYEVITVNNGSAALKKIAELKPDLIVLDVYMPGYSGLEVCQRLKEVQETARIPVLLTVGKLEPFKPEEAKRVRAEGYIVKPFEASELLSALSKLEDKIVPRAEPSKPGRFARANAALDEGKYEGKYDKSVAVEEDTSWKNRIAFPSKNKKAADDDSDDSTIYNAVNKDLRTVVDRAPGQEVQAREMQSEENRVDLGALAPEGLPKDVTPEEIAALAAAAAQVKGKLLDSAIVEYGSEPPVVAPAPVAEIKTAEEKSEVKEVVPATAELPREAAVESAATFAAHKAEESVEASAAKTEALKEAASATEMMAAIAELVPEPIKSTESNSQNASESQNASDQQRSEHHSNRFSDQPVTMAAAVGTKFGSAPSRWSAVAVALAPEESTISLEQEMQKAQATFASSEMAPHAESPAPVQEAPTASAEATVPQIAQEIATPEAESIAAVIPVPELAQPEAPRSTSSAASFASEALGAAVREFEKVAAYFEPQPVVQPETPAAPELAAAHIVEHVAEQVPESRAEQSGAPAIESVSEAPAAFEAKDHTAVTAVSEPETRLEAAKESAPDPVQEQKPEALKEVPSEEPRLEASSGVMVADPPAAAELSESSSASLESAAVDHLPSDPSSSDQSFAGSTSFETTAAVTTSEPVVAEVAAVTDAPKKEADIAETTAAAWASWRRIRESGDSKSAASQLKQSGEETSAPQEAAAMAVAAGAEKAPDETAAVPEDTGEIASIVDSMLADLRPKMLEEISRKLGKKK